MTDSESDEHEYEECLGLECDEHEYDECLVDQSTRVGIVESSMENILASLLEMKEKISEIEKKVESERTEYNLNRNYE